VEWGQVDSGEAKAGFPQFPPVSPARTPELESLSLSFVPFPFTAVSIR
jgi:hypothetical protein